MGGLLKGWCYIEGLMFAAVVTNLDIQQQLDQSCKMEPIHTSGLMHSLFPSSWLLHSRPDYTLIRLADDRGRSIPTEVSHRVTPAISCLLCKCTVSGGPESVIHKVIFMLCAYSWSTVCIHLSRSAKEGLANKWCWANGRSLIND